MTAERFQVALCVRLSKKQIQLCVAPREVRVLRERSRPKTPGEAPQRIGARLLNKVPYL